LVVVSLQHTGDAKQEAVYSLNAARGLLKSLNKAMDNFDPTSIKGE
jgi:hypothetical protein